jgi:RND superfamily putative drug exporter
MTMVETARQDQAARSWLVRLAGWSRRHRWPALLLWLALGIGLTAGAQVAGSAYTNDISLPGSESQQVLDALAAHQASAAVESVQIVFHDLGGLTEPTTRTAVQRMLEEVRGLDHVAAVSDPYADPAGLSRDGTTALSTVQLDSVLADLPPEAVRDVIDTAKRARSGTLQVELGGDAVRSVETAGGGPAEGVGLLAALVILVGMFGSLLAAGLPLITAMLGVSASVAIVALLSHLAVIPSYASSLMVLVGLGVGIDYALLVFSRYRAELLQGADREAATERALDTAGRAVLIAGVTVMIALLGLFTLGLPSLEGVALAVALTVVVTMVASLTLLPGLLALFGPRLERSIHRRDERSQRIPGARWRRWARAVRRRRWTAIIVATGALLALAAPVLDMRLGIADASTDAPPRTSRAAYDLLARGFGPGFNGPLAVLVTGDDPNGTAVGYALSRTDGVAAVAPGQPLPDGSGALVFVVPDSGPQDARTADLVERLRTEVLPQVSSTTGASYQVGGTPAAVADFSAAVEARLPAFVLTVVGLSALLLLLVFRSLAIPLKAAVLNLLSIGAALGVVTLVFQEGWFGAQQGPVEAFLPVMIFAIVFGLSMDYEVFLVTRMHEAWQQDRNAEAAIEEGLARTGGVITAAATIMIAVFGSFLLSSDRMLQQFGLGLAVAVLVDAVVIRCLLVPSVMGLLGARAWWLPRLLQRVVPAVALEPRSDAPSRSPVNT